MSTLNQTWFLNQVPGKPLGHYAHVITLRVTDSYALFQTDGELNTARVNSGVQDTTPMTRLTLFKRKQSTPERLVGRELLRRYGFISGDEAKDKKLVGADGLPICDYNVQFCTQCPDCISYGFAIGDTGSEKSKVITDTAYSLTPYDQSHETFTLNAPYEGGTMSRHGEVTSRINEQDHVLPQVIFPSIVTTRDLTANLFAYVLSNLQRTKRYGAQTTRTGRIRNVIVGIVLSDGEIFSNLLFTQRLFDQLTADGKMNNPKNPIELAGVMDAAQNLIPTLLKEDHVVTQQMLLGADLEHYLQTVHANNANETAVRTLLQNAFADSHSYFQTWIQKDKDKSKAGKKK
jgi:CRISPR-associated protein Csc2